ncbi:MAG TPA: 30S ribosomal protein S5 [bacterium]|nr:30S ribosomal protein S5 [bacterium]
MKNRMPKKEKEFAEKVVRVDRVTRVVKGGRRLRFRATVLVGDHKNRVGLGVAKANEVSDAVTKAANKAKKNLINVPIINNTIPHQINAKYCAGCVLLKPATEGTGVIAGGAVREVLEISGVKNVVAKNLGSRNKINSSKATIEALKALRLPDDIYQVRGIEKPVRFSGQAKSASNNDQPQAPVKPAKKAEKK